MIKLEISDVVECIRIFMTDLHNWSPDEEAFKGVITEAHWVSDGVGRGVACDFEGERWWLTFERLELVPINKTFEYKTRLTCELHRGSKHGMAELTFRVDFMNLPLAKKEGVWNG